MKIVGKMRRINGMIMEKYWEIWKRVICGKLWEYMVNYCKYGKYMGFDRKYGDCWEEGKYVKIWEIIKIIKNYRRLFKEIWEMETYGKLSGYMGKH